MRAEERNLRIDSELNFLGDQSGEIIEALDGLPDDTITVIVQRLGII